jgi:tRNA-Thr(GGU) m(6)t(6)A37 methyltransferase TsaA
VHCRSSRSAWPTLAVKNPLGGTCILDDGHNIGCWNAASVLHASAARSRHLSPQSSLPQPREERSMAESPKEPPLLLVPIGHIFTGRPDAVQIAAQATEASPATAQITLRTELADGLLGIERYRYLWILSWLHHADSADPPPLRLVPRAAEAAGQLQGVFASRAPRRPNSIGLSLVRHLHTRGNVITVAGVDLVHGTPVLDIKPWFRDCDDPRSFGAPELPQFPRRTP